MFSKIDHGNFLFCFNIAVLYILRIESLFCVHFKANSEDEDSDGQLPADLTINFEVIILHFFSLIIIIYSRVPII